MQSVNEIYMTKKTWCVCPKTQQVESQRFNAGCPSIYKRCGDKNTKVTVVRARYMVNRDRTVYRLFY